MMERLMYGYLPAASHLDAIKHFMSGCTAPRRMRGVDKAVVWYLRIASDQRREMAAHVPWITVHKVRRVTA